MRDTHTITLPAFAATVLSVGAFFLCFVQMQIPAKRPTEVQRPIHNSQAHSQTEAQNRCACSLEGSNESVRDQTRRVTIHRFWSQASRPDLHRKARMSLRAAVNTQSNARVIVWTDDRDWLAGQLKDIMPCGPSTVEARGVEELARLAEGALPACARSLRTQGDSVAFSDLVRFVALYVFGGIYADIDMVFLRDARDLHGRSFAFKWDLNVNYYNTAVMGLPVGSPVVSKLIAHAGGRCDPGTFWPERIHEAFECKSGVCTEMTMMPTALFGPVSSPASNWQWQQDPRSHELHTTTNWFFDREKLWGLEHFFPGAYTFHWHNRWDLSVHEKSFFAELERQSCRLDANKTTTCRRIFVDLGGYNGDTLALYGDKEKWDAIYVFEIDPQKVAAILQRLDGPLMRLKPITEVVNAAAWERDTILRVKLTGHNDGRATDSGDQWSMAYDIGAFVQRRLRSACDTAFVKMDIEGAEIQALESLDRAGVLRQTPHLIVEWHDWLMPDVAMAKPRLTAMLREQGLEYKYATLDDNLDKKYMPGEPWPVSHCDSHFFR